MAREVAEETLETLVKFHERHIFQKSLEDENYMFKFEDQFNVVYAVKFAWDPAKTHEFGVLRKVLASVSKLARGLPLTKADQAAVCKYRWFCKDKRLGDLLLHPAIVFEQEAVPSDALLVAQQRLAQELGVRAQLLPKGQGTLHRANIVKRVDDSWLEKDQLHLFSMPQIREMLCRTSITCRGSNCSQLDAAAIPWLQHVARLFCFQAFCGLGEAPDSEEEADEESIPKVEAPCPRSEPAE